ncbi:STRN3, partial [Symbiodinium pilosum]
CFNCSCGGKRRLSWPLTWLEPPYTRCRPIAVGECLRRLASKCLCAAVKDAAREVLAPLQLGVAVPYGAEAAVHTARQWCHRHASNCGKCFLTVDFANAFNSIDPTALLREVRLKLPGLAPYAEWRGFKRGTRWERGSLRWLCSLHFVLLLLADLAFAFLDDVCLAGSVQNVSSGLARLTAAARQVGLVLNPAKCCLTTCSDDCPVNPSLFPAGLP